MPTIPPLALLGAVQASTTTRVVWMVIAVLVLVAVVVIGSRAWWLPLLRRRLPQAAPVHEGDDHLKLALWASGEVFWDYDLVKRRLHRMRADEHSPSSGHAIAMLTRVGEVPLIHPHDMPLVTQRLRSHLRGEAPLFTSEHRMDMTGTGSWIWVRARGRVVESDTAGRALRLAGTARDITASRNAEYEHRVASEVMRSMSEAVAVLDAEYRFITVNPSFSRMTGYDGAEVAGQPLTLLDSRQNATDSTSRMSGQLQREGRWSGEAWKVRKDGEEILCRIETNVVPDASGQRLMVVLVLNDITEQKRAEQELRYLANYDTLTSLPNRSLLSERLSRAVVRARREKSRVAVLFIDLDRFKDINDSLGHATGDRILRAAAARVQETVGAQHTVARLSGDEFTVVLEAISSTTEAERVAERVIQAFSQPLAFGERLELAVSPSIGISVYPDHAQVPTELLKHADTAMYQAKSAGRHTWAVYSEAMDEKTRHRAILASALRRALERNELRVVYQPRLSLHDQQVIGTEALLRWESRELGEISPAQFIPLAEESGLIVDIGIWTLRQACQTLREWHDAGLDELSVAVNVSSLQLQRGDLADVVARVLAETGVNASCLELELTESVLMANPEQSSNELRACRALGVSIAIDDFGTGYSSLAYLKRLPLTTLKIDQEFVRDINHDVEDEAITSAIIAMARSLSLNVVAEGVETAAQMAFLQQRGCDEVQGHYVSRALERAQCLDFIRAYYPGADVFADA
ncbi:PAS domain S-box-containing protein/diguanylate cyclase (GGDEF) domain-containing protein [Pseudoxanthomonas sp. GM95]|uniref:putative bifunctional diguanylate cyclase/phosphodiesterase n=1 Tax=Pseudoxanthomonas sp. GM95 TaxID=1881043 RepID=UPI0008CD1F1F|nr:EAL domain-containing protein [Pseudoxanthomonas sp. GM95]SEL63840.1 PAS domain S-box-containing protein/diguanylate cyclase (GGDEF) domain-containing protein [Pseudoxanthomonas sp. GM95]